MEPLYVYWLKTCGNICTSIPHKASWALRFQAITFTLQITQTGHKHAQKKQNKYNELKLSDFICAKWYKKTFLYIMLVMENT